MPNQNVSVWTVTLSQTTNVACVHHTLMDATPAQPQTSAILVMLLFSETQHQRLMESVSVKMGTQKMTKKYVFCVQCQDAPTVKHKMFVVFVTLHFIECRHQLTVNAYVMPLTLKTQSINVCCVLHPDVLIVKAKTLVQNATQQSDSTKQSLMANVNAWLQSISIQTHARIAQLHCSAASYAAMGQRVKHATLH